MTASTPEAPPPRIPRRALLAAALGLLAGWPAPARAGRKARSDGDPDAYALEQLLDRPEPGGRVICLAHGVCFEM